MQRDVIKMTQKDHSQHIQTRSMPSRMDKALEWLEKSRDVWKRKCLAAKLNLKIKALSVKRLRDGRDTWKQRAKQAVMTIQEMKNSENLYLKEVDQLKRSLVMKTSEIEELKKKS